MAVQINVAANQAALTASIQAGVQAYNQRFAQNNQLNLTVNQRAFSQPLGRMTGDVKDFEAALAASNARVIAFGASTAVLGGVIRSFKELANVTIEVEKNLADINRVFGLTTSQLQKFSTDLFNVTKQTASSFNDASQAALEFSRQGLKAEETLQRTKDALTLTRLAGISTANAVDALTSTVNGFAATGVTTSQILNKLVAVEQDFAVGAGDLAEALSRTGQAAQEAGVSLDQLNALVTSAQQSTARGGAVIGNALKTIFTRLQRTETLDQLEAFNIAVRDVQGNILPAVTILQNFAGAYRGLADAQRAQLSEQVAGVYQVNILKAIVNDLNKSQGTYAGALQRGAAATNEAEVATAKLNQTLDALLKQTATSTQQLANNIGKVTFEPLAKYGTEQLKSFVESMNEILEGEGVGSTFANGLLKGIRNVIAGPGAIAAFFTLFKLIQNSFTYLAQALPQIAGITTETQNRKNIEQSILQIMQQQGPASQALAGLMGNQAAQAQLLLQIARQQTAEYQTQSTLAKQLAAQLATQGVRVKGSGGLQVTRAGGYIPAATRMAEVVGAQAGGYAPGRVVSSPVGGVMNTAEDVKYVPGFAQPFINPPAGSKAGRAHRQNSISRTGVDPYMANGFMPNFASNFTDWNWSQDFVETILGTSKKPTSKKSKKPFDLAKQKERFDAGRVFDNTIAIAAGLKQAYSEDNNILDYDPIEFSNDVIKNKLGLDGKTFWGDAKLSESSNNLDSYISKIIRAGYATLNKTSEGNWQVVPNTEGGSVILPQATGRLDKTVVHKTNKRKLIAKNESIKGKLTGLSDKDAIYSNLFLDRTKVPLEKTYVAKGSNKKETAEKLALNYKSKGFIPNFATPMSTASIPWFKKYSSKYKNAAGDTDLFKMGDFPTYGRGLDHEYAKNGNSAMLSYLHEDFVRSALNIALGSKKVIRPAEVGFKDKPVSDISNENDFDLLYRIADGSYSMLELKQDFKNVSGSVTGFMNKKLANLEKENPVLAKKVSSMIAVSNRPKFTDPTGRNVGANFSEFEMAAASIVKDKYSNVDPSISAKLTKVTDGLLRRYEAKKNTTYDGFIPNFAYKQAVMGLEESMSGNKAIFDTKPFPHIRNSGQPTFSSAIADHGGLGNALSDSMRGQKAAGLMSKGFIPNFNSKVRRRLARNRPSQQSSSSATPSGTAPNASPAIPVLSNDDIERAISDFINSVQSAEEKLSFFESAFGRSKLIKSETLKLENALKAGGVSGDRLSKAMTAASNQINQQQGKFAKGLSSASTAISLAGPMIAGFAEQALFGNRKRTEMTAGERQGQAAISTGLSAVTTGAGIGAAFGPQGALIGAAAGAVVGLVSAIDAAKLSLSELVEIDQELLKKQQASSQAASGYIDSQKKLNDLMASGASSQDIETATKNLSLSFNEIKDVNLAQIFANTGGNINKLQDELKKYNDELTKTAAGKSALGNLQQGGGFFDRTFMGGKTTAELGVKEPSEVAAELFRSSSLFKDPAMISAMKAGTNKDLLASVNRLATNRVGGAVPGLKQNAAQIAIAQKNYAKQFTDQLFPDLEKNDPARYQQELQRSIDLLFGKSGEAIAEGLEKMGKLEASNTAIQKVRNAALQGFAEIFGRIENSIKILSLQAAIALEKDSQINRVNSAINEFTTNFSESIESFVMNSLPEGPNKLGFTQFAAQRKYDDAIAKQQISAENFRLSQQKERNDYQKTREENITKLFKDVSLQSEQSAKFFKSDIYDKVKSGDLSGLSGDEVSKALTEKLIEQTRSLGLNASNKTESLQRVLADKGINLSSFNFSDKDKVGSLIETVGAVQNQIAATGGAGSNQTDLKDLIAKFQNSLGDLYNTQEFFTNKAKKQEYDAAIELARLEGDQFNQRMINAEKLFQVNQILEKTQLEATKTLSVERAKVDNANFMRMESMKNMSASIASNLEVSKAEGTRDINRLKRTLQDPTGVAGLGVSERSERQFKIQEQILNKERAIEDANINAEIQQRMLELAAERENTTALYNLSQVIEKFAAETLLKDLGGEAAFKEMQNNPYIGKTNQELDAAQQTLKLKTTGQRDRLEEQYKINQARSYSPEQLAKFEAYQRTRDSIDARRSGNTPTATVDAFADRMSEANFNKMNRDEQMKFLAEEREKADKAGAIALSNTIKRYEEQIVLRKQALDITRDDVNEQVKLDKQIIRTNNSFAGRFKTSFGNLKYEGEEILLKLGGDLPRMFADGLVNGIKAAIRESDNLGEALMGIAGNFLDAISTAMMQSAVYSILGSAGFNMADAAGSVPAPKQKGGFIRAQSGMYISGTGSGDKYPALLENGEYVLNRNAVMAMGGPSELDKLNFSMAPRFASGGSFATELNDLNSMEEGMTTYGLENSKLYNELRDVERAKQAEKRRKAFERKKMIAGIVGSVAGMAASFGIMKAAGSFGSSLKKDFGDVTMNVTPEQLAQNANLAQKGGHIGTRLSDTIPAYAEGGLYSSPIIKKYGVGMQNGGMYGGSSNNSNTVSNTNATNSFNFNTTVNRDGTIQMGADSTSYKQQDVELSNNLNSQVYKTVLDVIKQQQRFGGTLAGTRRPI